jgi:hypothetical protein
LRSCLENAGYAQLIGSDIALAETWLRRHDDPETLSASKRAFQAGRVTEAIAEADGKLAAVYDELYQRTIDFGGHPNERAATGSMKLEEAPGVRHYQQVYLHGDGVPLLHALKSAAQIGVCSLHVFQHIFKERFQILGIRERLIELRKRGI